MNIKLARKMLKTDPFTNEEFTPSRSNQKFACRKNRVDYHNNIARQKRMITRDVDYAMNSNWNILLRQLGGKQSVQRSKEFMLGAGFNFKYYQCAFRNKLGIVHVIYNCGFTLKEDSVTIYKLSNED